MSQNAGFGRRAFLRNAGMTALVGAVGASAPLSAAAAARTAPEIGADPPNGKFDFDTPYSRIGTDSTKWDRPNAQYNTKIIAGMGIADMDFKAAPSITKALTCLLYTSPSPRDS